MEQKKSTQQNIDDIFSSIDGIGRAELSPFFYTRVQANLDIRLEPATGIWSFVAKPAVSIVTLTLLLVLNIVAISHFMKTGKQAVTQETVGIQGFAEEYGLTTTSVYNDKTTR